MLCISNTRQLELGNSILFQCVAFFDAKKSRNRIAICDLSVK